MNRVDMCAVPATFSASWEKRVYIILELPIFLERNAHFQVFCHLWSLSQSLTAGNLLIYHYWHLYSHQLRRLRDIWLGSLFVQIMSVSEVSSRQISRLLTADPVP
jgi:hypothetical protein